MVVMKMENLKHAIKKVYFFCIPVKFFIRFLLNLTQVLKKSLKYI